MPIKVNVDNFTRAETDRMFAAILRDSGGTNRWMHNRVPTPIDHQPVIRQNRDTLYSVNLFDASGTVTFNLPPAGDRYLSLMVVNEDHYVTHVLHEPGEHRLLLADVGTAFALAAVRILVDPADPADLTEVNRLQDACSITADSSRPFALPDYDTASLDATRSALLELARGLEGFAGAFGKPGEVNPVRHLIGSAAGWGGLPEQEALYLNVDPGLPVGEYRLSVRDVPVDGFWSVSLYNAQGYFEENARQAYSVNSITGVKNADGAMTIRFGTSDSDEPNYLPIMTGWNYVVRMYRPRSQVLDRSWTFPKIEAVG